MTARPGATLGVIGDIVQDIVVSSQAEFAAASDTPSRIIRRRGGSGANVAAAAAPLVATRFFGCVGDDGVGADLAKALLGVDARLQVVPGRSGAIVVLVDAAGERHMFPDRGVNTQLGPVSANDLDELAALHVTAYSLDGGTTPVAVMTALGQVSQAGGVTSLDLSSTAVINHIGLDALRSVVASIGPTIIFANQDEAALFDADQNEVSQTMIVVKHGAQPTLVRTSVGAWRVPVEPITVSDSTGAGDAFAAGLLAKIVLDGLTRESLRDADQSLATALALAGHVSAKTWLENTR